MNWMIAVVMSLAVGFAMADKSASSAGVVGKALTAVVKKLALIVYWSLDWFLALGLVSGWASSSCCFGQK